MRAEDTVQRLLSAAERPEQTIDVQPIPGFEVRLQCYIEPDPDEPDHEQIKIAATSAGGGPANLNIEDLLRALSMVLFQHVQQSLPPDIRLEHAQTTVTPAHRA